MPAQSSTMARTMARMYGSFFFIKVTAGLVERKRTIWSDLELGANERRFLAFSASSDDWEGTSTPSSVIQKCSRAVAHVNRLEGSMVSSPATNDTAPLETPEDACNHCKRPIPKQKVNYRTNAHARLFNRYKQTEVDHEGLYREIQLDH